MRDVEEPLFTGPLFYVVYVVSPERVIVDLGTRKIRDTKTSCYGTMATWTGRKLSHAKRV